MTFCCVFTSESVCEKILKIGQHLAVMDYITVACFFDSHRPVPYCIKHNRIKSHFNLLLFYNVYEIFKRF